MWLSAWFMQKKLGMFWAIKARKKKQRGKAKRKFKFGPIFRFFWKKRKITLKFFKKKQQSLSLVARRQPVNAGSYQIMKKLGYDPTILSYSYWQ